MHFHLICIKCMHFPENARILLKMRAFSKFEPFEVWVTDQHRSFVYIGKTNNFRLGQYFNFVLHPIEVFRNSRFASSVKCGGSSHLLNV